MTKLRGPLLSLKAQGTIADALTFECRGSPSIVRTKPETPYFLTLPVQYQRWLYQDYIAYWHQQDAATKQTYQSAGVRFHLTGFQYWMKYHLKNLPDLVGWWKLDDFLGATVADSSRNTNPGTIFGASPATGIISGCLSFDGINDRVNCGVGVPNLGTSDFTLECFFRRNGNPPIVEILVQKWGSAAPADNGYFLRANVNGTIRFSCRNILQNNLDTLGAYCDNQWHHMRCVRDSTAQYIYVDRALDNSAPFAPLNVDNVNPFVIGSRWPDGTWYFDGLIDNVMLYRRALTTIPNHHDWRWPPQ